MSSYNSMHNVYEGLSLPVGCGVMIVGLQTRRELNGAHATICAWNSNKERFLVEFDPKTPTLIEWQKQLLVKKENLIRTNDPDKIKWNGGMDVKIVGIEHHGKMGTTLPPTSKDGKPPVLDPQAEWWDVWLFKAVDGERELTDPRIQVRVHKQCLELLPEEQCDSDEEDIMDEIDEVVETMPVGQSSVNLGKALREKRRRNVGGKGQKRMRY